MKILAINGSPRKNGNTATLLNKALEGAISQGAEVKIIHLYDLEYKGCNSCFACKLKNGKSYGKCAVKDDLAPIFKEIKEADGLILGSPIYDGSVTGEMASFLERLIFPLVAYDKNVTTLFGRKMPTAFIYTMNANEKSAEMLGYGKHLSIVGGALNRIFGSTESMFVYDTQQFDDYSRYVSDLFDPAKKAKRREEVFPLDCEKAFDVGARFARNG